MSGHLRTRAVCRVANPRDSAGYRCGLRLASHPDPQRRLLEHAKLLEKQVNEIETQIKGWHRHNKLRRRLAQVHGIGPMTATALVAKVGNARNFKNGRGLAAWLGLVPRQHSSGGKSMLLSMSKRGDVYLRTLLIHGARSLAYRVGQKVDPESWLSKLMNRRNANIAVGAQVNKTVRVVWTMLLHAREFRP